MKKVFYLIMFFSLVFILSACTKAPTAPITNNEDLEIPIGNFYFKSKNCAHCTVVENYINENNVKAKVFFVTREIEGDQSAVQLLKSIGKKCLLSDTEIGVPLFWDGSNCYLGDEKVIDYFKSLSQ